MTFVTFLTLGSRTSRLIGKGFFFSAKGYEHMAGLFFDDYDTPVFRPPSEADSFILRVTRGCAHNSCTYCNMYRGVKFEKLSDEQIMRQIAIAYSVDRDGVRRVFLADGDALVLPTERLLKILNTLKKYFPQPGARFLLCGAGRHSQKIPGRTETASGSGPPAFVLRYGKRRLPDPEGHSQRRER